MNLDIWFSIGVSIDSDIDPYKSEENWKKIAKLAVEKVLQNSKSYINIENIEEITKWED